MAQFVDTETLMNWPKPVKVTVIVEDPDDGVLFRLVFDKAERFTQMVRTLEPDDLPDPRNTLIRHPDQVVRAGIHLGPIPDPADGTWAKIYIPNGSPFRADKEGT
jgi:hypothetical protein